MVGKGLKMKACLKNPLLVWKEHLLCCLYNFNDLTDSCMRLKIDEDKNILRSYNHLLLNGNVYNDEIIIKEESARINIYIF